MNMCKMELSFFRSTCWFQMNVLPENCNFSIATIYNRCFERDDEINADGNVNVNLCMRFLVCSLDWSKGTREIRRAKYQLNY